MTEQLTGYEASSVAEIEAILDAIPADADTVYLDTIAYSERAIAAVAAKRAGSGGGSTPDGSVLPNATPTGATLDTTSYDDPANPGTKLATLVLPTNAPILAVAIEGDAFPRWVMYADATLGLFMGDGSYDPFNTGENALSAGQLLGDGLIVGQRPGRTLGFGTVDPGGKRPGYSDLDGGLQINTPAGSNGAMLASGHGAPAIGGEVGDIFIRTDPGGASETIYRCTVAGTAGNATWTGIL